MKILYHHRTRCTGADGSHIYGVAGGFEKLGHSVVIISPAGCVNAPDGRQAELAPSAANRGSLLTKAPRVLFEAFELFYNLPLIWRLAKQQARGRFDMVYERYAFMNLGGLFLSCFFGLPLFLEVNFTSRTEVYPKRTGIFGAIEKWIEHMVFKQAVIIIVISENLKQDIVGRGISGDKILVTPNAVELDNFVPGPAPEALRKQYNLSHGDKVIGFVGSFYPWHGLDFLLDAFKQVSLELNNVKLMLLGDGQLHSALKERAKNENLADSVIFAGRVSHSRLADYLALFDIGVMPDSNEYGSPMKIFEYMAMGKPVVAPRLGPIEAVITDNQEGMLFKRKDITEFKNILLVLLKDNGLCRRLGELGRQKVCAEHTWENNVGRMIKLYGRLANNEGDR